MTLTDPRLAYASLPALIWTAGPDGTIDYLSQRWTDVTGRPVDEMLGWGWSDRLHPDDRERVLAEYGAAVSERTPAQLEFRLLHRDGEHRRFLGNIEPCYRSNGEFLGYSGCATDVTDRRELEQRLAQLGRRGEIAQLGAIAHDFNNLVTGIMGHTSLLLEEGSLSLAAQEDLSQIRQAADRAATLTRQLLAMSRRPQLAPRFLDLNQLLSGAMTAIRKAVGSAIEVSYELEEGLEPVVADSGQLEQILLRLSAHGRAALPGGGRLRFRTGRAQVDEAMATTRPDLRPGSYVILEVGHIGSGLDHEALKRVFEPAGDLSLVASIVKQSGGHVTVESTPEERATFTLYIPRRDGAIERGGEPEVGTHEGTETILLVEDDVQVREVSRRAMEGAGYSVLTASDAEAAIATADRHPGHIHLLVTDVVLPGAGGRELAARLAIHRPAIKVLYVSGSSDSSIARHRLLEPGIEFLGKPFSLDQFLRKVRQILGVDLSAEEPTAWTRSLV